MNEFKELVLQELGTYHTLVPCDFRKDFHEAIYDAWRGHFEGLRTTKDASVAPANSDSIDMKYRAKLEARDIIRDRGFDVFFLPRKYVKVLLRPDRQSLEALRRQLHGLGRAGDHRDRTQSGGGALVPEEGIVPRT